MGAPGGGPGVYVYLNSTANTAGVTQMAGALQQLQTSMANLQASTANVSNALAQLSTPGAVPQRGTPGAVTSDMNLLGQAFEWAGGKMMGFLSQVWAVTGGLISFNILDQVTAKVRALGQEMITLNETMQKQDVGWAYLFGNTSGPNYGAASQMLSFTASQSYNMPYTRLDMNAAVRTMSMLGLSEKDIEHYMPILADLGVRNPGIGMAQIAQAILGAQMGMPRMLKYELAIPDQALIPYGLDMNSARSIDPATLLPALENYARAQGYYSPTGKGGQDIGASYALARNTYMGAMTSFQDRYQNFLLQLGGSVWGDPNNPAGAGMVRNPTYNQQSTNPADRQQYIFKQQMVAGDVRQNSVFDVMIKGLNGITQWWDDHQREMNDLSDLFGNMLGQGLHNASDAFASFFQGLQQSGVGNKILQDIEQAAQWLADPKNQAQIQAMASSFGEHLGKAIIDTDSAIKDLVKSWGDLVKALGADTPGGGGTIFDIIAGAIEMAIGQLARFGQILADIVKIANDLGHNDWGAALADVKAMGGDFANFFTAGGAATLSGDMQKVQAAQAAAQHAALNQTPVNNRPKPGQTAGYSAGGVISGGSVSWGGTTNNVYITGADSRTVQQVVDTSTSSQAVDTLLATRRPGASRAFRVGFY